MRLDKRKIAAQSQGSCWSGCDTAQEVLGEYGLAHSLDSLAFAVRGKELAAMLYEYLFNLVITADPCEASRELFFHAIRYRNKLIKVREFDKERIRLGQSCHYLFIICQCAVPSPYEVSHALNDAMQSVYCKHMRDAYDLAWKTEIMIRKGEDIEPIDISECRAFAERSIQALTEEFERYFLRLLPHYDSDDFYSGKWLTSQDLE